MNRARTSRNDYVFYPLKSLFCLWLGFIGKGFYKEYGHVFACCRTRYYERIGEVFSGSNNGGIWFWGATYLPRYRHHLIFNGLSSSVGGFSPKSFDFFYAYNFF